MLYLDERELDDLSSSGFSYDNCHTCTTTRLHTYRYLPITVHMLIDKMQLRCHAISLELMH